MFNMINIDDKKNLKISDIDSIIIKSKPVTLSSGSKDSLISITIKEPSDIEIIRNTFNLNVHTGQRIGDPCWEMGCGNLSTLLKSGTKIEILGIFAYSLESEYATTKYEYYANGKLITTEQEVKHENKTINIEEEGKFIIDIVNDAEYTISYEETNRYKKISYPNGTAKTDINHPELEITKKILKNRLEQFTNVTINNDGTCTIDFAGTGGEKNE